MFVGRFIARIVLVVVLSLSLAPVALPFASIPAGPAQSCCAQMSHHTGHCPPPAQGPTGSCCNLPVCVCLILQTREINLAPGFVELEWSTFAAREIWRAKRPDIPPPRVALQ